MAEPGGDADLVEKPLGAEPGGELGAQHLEGHLALVPQVAGKVDGGHAASTELPLNLVAIRQGLGQPGELPCHRIKGAPGWVGALGWARARVSDRVRPFRLSRRRESTPAKCGTFSPMLRPTRRHFLLGLAALAPLPFVARRLHARAVAALDPARLRALGEAVLPAELGAAGGERVVTAFERWLADYREGAESLHGYGTPDIRVTGPSPALRWAGQLEALDKNFTTISRADRQAAVRGVLESSGTRFGPLPPVDRAPHLAIGLLSFYYSSSEATDLCYQARIGPNRCRPLAESSRKPLPLAPGS